MRRHLTLFLFALQSIAAILAQGNGTGFIGNGYYRIHNFATNRYIYVTDNKDYYNKTHDNEDFQAIQLWKNPNKAISDPASVIYIQEVTSGNYDLKAQGTGVHSLTGYYVNVSKKADGTYEVSATKAGVTKYLSDDKSDTTKDQGKLGTSNTSRYRRWIVDRIYSDHSTNYVGIKPTITLNDKYYHPFFADFPFKVTSPNMHVYYINKISGGNAFIREIEGEIPARTPVIIECASTNPSDNRIELLNSTSVKVTDNKLSGVYFCNGERPEKSVDAYTKFDASTMRVLTVADGKLIMTNDAPNRLKRIHTIIDWLTEREGDIDCIPANTSYLKVSAGTPAVLNLLVDSGTILGDLNGDGKVDIADAVAVLNIIADGKYNKNADINNDQKIDIADFVAILNIMTQQSSITGDLNGDGKVDIADAVTVLNIMATGKYDKAADINNDQQVDIADFVSILNIMAKQQ
ncbi:MAG: dockerin type I repeat-containing protein [Bacteroidaceae bacterium]|nr:dockerin type I repeat-containing protein [Bacteroidaceae bacterium]